MGRGLEEQAGFKAKEEKVARWLHPSREPADRCQHPGPNHMAGTRGTHSTLQGPGLMCGTQGDSDAGEAGCSARCCGGLWGPAGHSSAFRGSCQPGLLGEKALSSHISWQPTQVLDYDGADGIKYIHRPSRSQREKNH